MCQPYTKPGEQICLKSGSEKMGGICPQLPTLKMWPWQCRRDTISSQIGASACGKYDKIIMHTFLVQLQFCDHSPLAQGLYWSSIESAGNDSIYFTYISIMNLSNIKLLLTCNTCSKGIVNHVSCLGGEGIQTHTRWLVSCSMSIRYTPMRAKPLVNPVLPNHKAKGWGQVWAGEVSKKEVRSGTPCELAICRLKIKHCKLD